MDSRSGFDSEGLSRPCASISKDILPVSETGKLNPAPALNVPTVSRALEIFLDEKSIQEDT